MNDKFTRIAYDCVLKRPGCVLLQALFGCQPRVVSIFPTQSWLLAPTENLRVYPLGPGQLEKLVAITEKHLKEAEREL